MTAMVVDVTCPHCSKAYELPLNVVGKNVQCASCRQKFSAVADSPPPGMFATRCSHCQRMFAAPDRLMDQRTTCPSCSQVFVASSPQADPLDAAAEMSLLQPVAASSYRPPKPSAAAKSATKKKKKKAAASQVGYGNKMHPALQIVIGVAMGGGGAIVSMASYQNAQPGQQYTVFTGLIVVGLVTALSGVFRLMGGKVG